MGCITSREWPPKPYKRYLVRPMLLDNIEMGAVQKTQIPEEDYVWVRPGESHQSTSHGPEANWKEELGPWQEVAVRQLEDG